MERRRWWWWRWSPPIPRPGGVPERRLLAPETEFRDVAAFWRVSGDFDFSPCVFRSRPINSPKEGVGGRPRGPHHRAARAPPRPRRLMVWGPRASTWLVLLAPSVFWENRAFCINSEDFPESWISAQKRDTRTVLLKTALVRVSCIQNTQIRGKTIAKVFGKVDTFWTYQLPPSLAYCLSSSNSVNNWAIKELSRTHLLIWCIYSHAMANT